MNVLSLFDGMSCGAIAFREMGIDVERYVAYEIDKYAVQVSAHNFPAIEQRGDVFAADFTEFDGFDAVIGGSPCTYWSIAQKNNRETEASGLGWELFSQYVRAIKEAKPKFFLYENNKSMSKEIRASITETFGFEPILINSALVSAQNRNRLYWVGIRQADGTYSKADIGQPEDRRILLKDVLDCGCDLTSNEKSYCLTSSYDGAVAWNTIERSQRNMVAEPVNTTTDGKAQTVRASCYKDGIRNMVGNTIDRKTCVANPIRVGDLPNDRGEISGSQATRIYAVGGKSVNLVSNGGGQGAKTGLYACPVLQVPEATRKGFTEIVAGDCVDLTQPNSKTRRGRNMRDKSNCIMTGCAYYQYCGTIDQPIYEVKNGLITIRDKQYPIKLIDGFYIIRKLTVSECKRLQTVPDWYDFSPISNSQAYKCLGNGWTVDVIVHILSNIKDS